MVLRLSSSSLLLMLSFLHVSILSHGPSPGPGPFLRSKRANSFLLEEILQGNLERECMEEVCNYEEAREVFEDHHKTARFWARYYDGDQCESAPCGNGGNCTDTVGGFHCTCPAPFFGETCELGPGTGPEPTSDPDLALLLKGPESCQTSGPGSCEQLCTASDFSVSCSCLSGFRLKSDGRHCEPHVKFPCGQIPDQLQTQSLCTNHRCPWQVSVLDWSGVQLCWGALLGHSMVLTSAHCLQSKLGTDLDPNKIFIRLIGQRRALHVKSVDVHERFSFPRHDYDLALLHMARPLHLGPALLHLCIPAHRDHTENVLMHAGKQLLVGSHRSGTRSVTLEACRQNSLSHALSNKMFCLETWTALGQGQDVETTRDTFGLEQHQKITETTLELDHDPRTRAVLGQDQTWGLGPYHRPDHRPDAETAHRSQNGHQKTSDSQHPAEPDLEKTSTRNRTMDQTRDQNQSHDPRTESRYSKAQSNEDNIEAQNGHLLQDQPGSNQSQQGQIQNSAGLNQDHLRLNQDPKTTTKPTPNTDQMLLDPLPSPTEPNQNQTGQTHNRSKPAHTELAQNLPQGRPQDPLHPRVRGLLAGAPVVSVDRGTAYLVGLLTSTAPAGGGRHILVFTKLSRHMTWLQERLGHTMTGQTNPRP